ncbi:hypothetical protein [Streptomyces sp. NRRL B-3229]|nr:hypothetical protein [Streptomyces sp. NRRL B-3229]
MLLLEERDAAGDEAVPFRQRTLKARLIAMLLAAGLDVHLAHGFRLARA